MTIDEQYEQHQADEMSQLRERTGTVTISARGNLISFLYELLRDELPAGTVERLVQSATFRREGIEKIVFTNGHLARYAEDIASRLLEGP